MADAGSGTTDPFTILGELAGPRKNAGDLCLLLTRYGYPPDKQPPAMDLVMDKANRVPEPLTKVARRR